MDKISNIVANNEIFILSADLDNIIKDGPNKLQKCYTSLKLIDFGCGIDKRLFSIDTQFKSVLATKEFQCIEEKTDTPWTVQVFWVNILITYTNEYITKLI